MPIFEFKCISCGREFERVVFASESEPVACPKCGSPETRKQMSVVSSCGLGKTSGATCSSSSGHS